MNIENKKTILIIASGGGFAWETKTLMEQLILEDNTLALVVAYPKESFEFREYFLTFPLINYHLITNRNGLKPAHIISMLKTFIIAIKVLSKSNIDYVIGIGHSANVLFFLAAKLFGKKRCYIESITRTNSLSRTAKILLKLKLVDEVLVQWPNILPGNRRVRYEGNIL